MTNLTLELNINSASNLRNVNLMTKMDVYGVITLHGDDTQSKQKVKTAVHRSGGSNPTWNHAIEFSINERLARDDRLTLKMRLMSHRLLLGNKYIGGVNIALLDLLNSVTPSINGYGNSQRMKVITYQVRSRSGKQSGSLTFSYRFKMDPPPPQIEHTVPSAPPEVSIEFPNLTEPQHHQEHSFAAGSSNDDLPICYSPYYHMSHAALSQSHQGHDLYGYMPLSLTSNRYECSSYISTAKWD